MNFRLLIFCSLAVVVYLTSCKQTPTYTYPNDDNLTNAMGMPKKRGISFFPTSWFIDSTKQTASGAEIDSVHLRLFSKVLSKIGEPILYNCYTGKTVVRLIWLRPNRPSMVLSLEDIDNKLYLKENGFVKAEETIKTQNGKDSLVTEKRIFKSKGIDYQNMVKIRELIAKNKFFEMSPTIYQSSCMGAKFVLEVHEPTNYHLAFRCISNETEEPVFRELCDFLIDLSNYKDEPRY